MRLRTTLLILSIMGCEAKPPQIGIDQIESLNVKLYKNKDFTDEEHDFSVVVPRTHWDTILALTLPHRSTMVGSDKLRIGVVTIHKMNKTSIAMDIYFSGKNPCIVSLDGKHFFYAKNTSAGSDGGMELIRRIIAIRKSTSKKGPEDQNQ